MCNSDFLLGAVAGSPVFHSASPEIWNYAFKINHLNGRYLRLSAQNAKDAINLFNALNLSFMNVTTPLKEEVMPYINVIDEKSENIGAVNLIIRKGNMLYGYNTDGDGAVSALNSAGINPAKKKIAILGAGATGRAAAETLSKSANITIFNRTSEKAADAAKKFFCNSAEFSSKKNDFSSYDIIITALSGEYEFSENAFRKGQTILEANYRNPKLKKVAESIGLQYISGESWLINQAVSAMKTAFGIQMKPTDFAPLAFGSKNSSKKHDEIALIGFTGSGKSSLGRILAEELGWEFTDSDEIIETSAGKSIAQIITQFGGEYFRKLETQAIKSVMQKKLLIFAAGGGAPIFNKSLFAEKFYNILIYSPLEKCLSRIDINSRPLLTKKSLEEIKKFFNFRINQYIDIADTVIFNNGSFENIKRQLYEEINSFS